MKTIKILLLAVLTITLFSCAEYNEPVEIPMKIIMDTTYIKQYTIKYHSCVVTTTSYQLQSIIDEEWIDIIPGTTYNQQQYNDSILYSPKKDSVITIEQINNVDTDYKWFINNYILFDKKYLFNKNSLTYNYLNYKTIPSFILNSNKNSEKLTRGYKNARKRTYTEHLIIKFEVDSTLLPIIKYRYLK